MHKLANQYRYLKNFPRSIELFETLLGRRIAGLRSCHPDILLTYHDAAASYVRLGKYDEAERCYRLELEGSIKEFGRLNPETMRRKQNLASFLSGKGLKGEDAQRKVKGTTTNEQVSSDQLSMME
jgi:tetratricopeptide (TPR) repeat protein